MNAPARRLAGVDALRGLAVAAMLLVNDPGDWGHVYAPLLHSDWNGCTPTDLVFPLFLFVVGVSVALAIVPRVQAGALLAPLRRAIAARALRIVACGLLLNALAWWWMGVPHFRVWGVLQRIGVCFAATGWLATCTRPRTQAWLVAVLLLGYGAAMSATGGWGQWTNLASRIDTALLGTHVYAFDAATGRGHDPEGLLSTLPALATCLLGLLAGQALQAGRARRLPAFAAGLLLAGWATTAWMPWNKNLWTPSFVLWSGGWAMAALWLLHGWMDVRGHRVPGRSLGRNAITVYVGSEALVIALVGAGVLAPLYATLFAGWMTPRFGPYLPSLAYALCFTAAWWGVAWLMDRRGLRVTV